MLGRTQKEQDFPQTGETGKGSDEQDIEGSRKRQSALVPAHLPGRVVERQDGCEACAAGRVHACREAQVGPGLGLCQPLPLGSSDMCRVDLCGEGPEMPRLRFLPSQENGARFGVIENGERSIFSHWSLWTRIISFIRVKPLALGQAQRTLGPSVLPPS